MFDVREAPEQFARLAALAGAKAEVDPLAELGPRPIWVHDMWLKASNDDLRAGIYGRPIDLSEVREACLATPPASWRSREDWRNWVAGLAWAAIERPDLSDGLRALAHECSSRDGAWERRGEFADGYATAANDAQWEIIFNDTERRMADGSDFRTLGSLFHDARALGWERAVEPSPLPAKVTGDLSKHLLSNPPGLRYKRRPVLEGVGIRGDATALVSKGGGSKSTVASTCVASVATGRNLIGIEPGPRLTVAMCNAEDAEPEVRLRLEATAQHHGIELSALNNVYIFGVDDMYDIELSELGPDGRSPRPSERGLGRLRQLLVATGAKFAILDPLAAMVPYGLNDTGVMAGVMKGLKRIAAELDCAILLIAHTHKSANADTEGAEITAGSAAIPNLARGVMTVRTLSERSCRELGVMPGEERDIRELVDLKANLRRLGDRKLFKLVGVPMDNATDEFPDQDWVAVAEAFTPQPVLAGAQIPQSTLKLGIDAVACGAIIGGWPLSPSANAGAARNVITVLQLALASAHPGGASRAPAAFADAVAKELNRLGWIVRKRKVSTGNNNSGDGIFVDWGITPWSALPPSGRNVV